MAYAKKDLPGVNDELVMVLGEDENGAASLTMISGAGTVVLEGDPTGDGTWVSLPVGGTQASVAAAGAAAVSEVIGMKRIRARKSVGALACVIGLRFGRP